ncbi:MAG: YqjK-like family protein [Enterobacteriaceae bacterium]|nr:YqjK-like family protein [Enterobacteriaceae bacterium]
MNRKQILSVKKALLVDKIRQQRTDLAQECDAWLASTAPIDKGWLTLQKYPQIAGVALGILAVYGLRSPKKLLLWSRCSLGIWTAVNIVRQHL